MDLRDNHDNTLGTAIRQWQCCCFVAGCWSRQNHSSIATIILLHIVLTPQSRVLPASDKISLCASAAVFLPQKIMCPKPYGTWLFHTILGEIHGWKSGG